MKKFLNLIFTHYYKLFIDLFKFINITILLILNLNLFKCSFYFFFFLILIFMTSQILTMTISINSLFNNSLTKFIYKCFIYIFISEYDYHWINQNNLPQYLKYFYALFLTYVILKTFISVLNDPSEYQHLQLKSKSKESNLVYNRSYQTLLVAFLCFNHSSQTKKHYYNEECQYK